MRIAAIGLLLLSAPAWAGDMYSFTLEKRGGLEESVRRGRVLVEGNRYRLEFEPDEVPRPYEVAISRGEGEERIFLNPASRTYYKEHKAEPRWPSHSMLWLYSMLPGQKRTVTNVRLEVGTPSVETVAGQATQKHEIRVSYDLAVKHVAETLRGKLTIEVVTWLVEESSLLLAEELRPEVRTLFPEVDGPLNEALSKLRGFPMKQQVTVTADMKQGVPQTQVVTITVQELKPAETRADLFELPSGFTYKKPEITAPGLAPPR
jgi:hypothetical protein